MTEREYLMATNHVKLRAARSVLASITPGAMYGVDSRAMETLIEDLAGIQADCEWVLDSMLHDDGGEAAKNESEGR